MWESFAFNDRDRSLTATISEHLTASQQQGYVSHGHGPTGSVRCRERLDVPSGAMDSMTAGNLGREFFHQMGAAGLIGIGTILVLGMAVRLFSEYDVAGFGIVTGQAAGSARVFIQLL
jgi:hypothetical protein